MEIRKPTSNSGNSSNQLRLKDKGFNGTRAKWDSKKQSPDGRSFSTTTLLVNSRSHFDYHWIKQVCFKLVLKNGCTLNIIV